VGERRKADEAERHEPLVVAQVRRRRCASIGPNTSDAAFTRDKARSSTGSRKPGELAG
jgi:hypothetical protein